MAPMPKESDIFVTFTDFSPKWDFHSLQFRLKQLFSPKYFTLRNKRLLICLEKFLTLSFLLLHGNFLGHFSPGFILSWVTIFLPNHEFDPRATHPWLASWASEPEP